MAKKVFTDATVRSLEPPAKGQAKYWDAHFPGFGVRVSQGGSKTFVLRRDNSFITIGRYPILSLSDARTEAKRRLAEFTLGHTRPQAVKFAYALEQFLDDKKHSLRPRTLYDYRRHMGLFGFRGQLGDISPDEATRKLKKITAPSERSHMLVAGKVFFNWCRRRRYWIGDSPLLGLTKPPTKRRNRVLADEELKLVWQATAEPTNYNRIVRAVLVMGQRPGELTKLVPTLATETLLTIPDTIAKNRTEHQFPLCAMSAALLRARHNYELLFSDTAKPFRDWNSAKLALDQRIADLNGAPIPHWVVYDLRRTYRTRHAQLKTPPHIAERLVHHISSRTEVERIYDQYNFLPEMREAQEKYERFLSELFSENVSFAAAA